MLKGRIRFFANLSNADIESLATHLAIAAMSGRSVARTSPSSGGPQDAT